MDNSLSMYNPNSLLVTGGAGLLGSAFQKLVPRILYPSSQDFDITNPDGMRRYLAVHSVQTIIHAAAFTSPPKINADPIRALSVNIVGTANVVQICAEQSIRLIYISTDYVFDGESGMYREDDAVAPVNKYAWSKLGGECAVRLYDNSLIIRTSFGQVPFPFEGAYIDQWTSRETVAQIAAKILSIVDISICGVLHIAGARKSVYDYATHIDPSRSLKPLSIAQSSARLPRDTSLNTEKFKKLIAEKII